ncbi:hypothetical protein CALVIDRAFT_381095 [Calocera viscosa TUFC12733]|uniref:Ras-GAP domain-containing protein n=1 Tax=Calocera viscosa (strain TUFC12733) TaxID=1330018 RepID=A0A167Q5K8_CALVF|nr:hypothetical protein CALVIDRAFT_381095 [Calocera viscosa TUFC12733]
MPSSNRPEAHRSGLSHSLSISRGGIPFMRRRPPHQQHTPHRESVQQTTTPPDDTKTMATTTDTRSDESSWLKPAISYSSLRSGTPHDRVLNSLIMRLKGELPVHSKRTLSMVEGDEALSQTVASIVQLAKFRLDGVAWALANLLDELNAGTSPPLGSASSDPESRYPPLEVLQSQVFVLKVLSAALAYKYQQHGTEGSRATRGSIWSTREDRTRQASSSTASSQADLHSARMVYSPPPRLRSLDEDSDRVRLPTSSSGSSLPGASPVIATATHGAYTWSPSAIQSPVASMRDSPMSTSQASYPHTSDAPQMTEQVAKYVLLTLLPYLRKSSPGSYSAGSTPAVPATGVDYDRPTNIAHLITAAVRPLRSRAVPSTPFTASVSSVPSTPAMLTPGYSPSSNSPHASFPHPQRAPAAGGPTVPLPQLSAITSLTTPLSILLAPVPPAWATTPKGCRVVIYGYITQIILHLSASNWNVVYERIQTKIRDVGSGEGRDREGGDMTEIELISLSFLSRGRLIQILNDLASLLIQMRRSTQTTMAIAVHAAIMKWMNTCPSEFVSLIQGDYRLDGTPERVFDTLLMVEHTNPKIFLPALSMLLAVSPDRLRSLTVGQYNKPMMKKNILETLSKYLNSGTQQSEIAVACYLDLCAAAIHLPPGDDGSALGELASELADDLRVRLITPSPPMKPFWNSYDIIDTHLYADAIVAMFWFSPTYTVENVLPKLFAPEQAYAVKLVGVKALIRVAAEQVRLPHQPHVSQLYSLTSQRLPDLYHTLANPPGAEDDTSVFVHYHPRMKQTELDNLDDRDTLLLAIVGLWRSDLSFLGSRDDSDRLVKNGARVTRDSQVLLRTTSQQVLRTVVTQLLIEIGIHVNMNMGPGFNAFHDQDNANTSSILCLVSDRLLASRGDYDDQRLYLSTLQTCLMHLPHNLATPEVSPAIFVALNLVEVALLSSVVTPMMDICAAACSCLSLLADCEELTRSRSDATLYLNHADIVSRVTAYKQLSDPSDPAIGGRAYQQRRIRTVLKQIAFAWPINVATWQEYHRKLSTFDPSVIRSTDHAGNAPSRMRQSSRWDSSGDEQFDWQNTLLFLATFAGCCLGTSDMQSLADFVPRSELPEQFLQAKPPELLLSSFLASTCEVLLRGAPFASNTVRDALGSDLDPRCYPQLLGHLERLCIANFERPSATGGDWDDDTLFMMLQVSTVLSRILANPDAVQLSATRVDFGRIILLFHDFINTYEGDVEETLRAKLQFASLCEAAFSCEDLSLASDFHLRQTCLNSFSEWVTDIQPGRSASTGPANLIKDVENAILKAVVILTDGLPLKSDDDGSKVQEQSRMFYHYFRFFLGIIMRTLASVDVPKNLSTLDLNQPVDLLGLVAPTDMKTIALERDMKALREKAFSSLANLLFANHQAGFKHCFSMTFHEDSRIRAAFLQIFKEALDRGTAFQMSQELPPTIKSNVLIEFVRDPNLLVVQALCEVAAPNDAVEDLESVLLHIFDQEESLVALAKVLIEQEFQRTSQEAELFRNNSLRNRLLSRIAREQSSSYLRRVLSPLMKRIVELPPDLSLEIDPHKTDEDANTSENAKALVRITTIFLATLEAASSRVPNVIREICHHIAVIAGKVFPNNVYASVAGFMFLRCINPAISQPSTVGIEIDMTPRNQRVLLLVTKVIQNLANNVLFGKEGTHMEVLNDYMVEPIGYVWKFLRDVSSDPRHRPVNWSEIPVRYADETDVLILHRFFHRNLAPIGQQLLTMHTKASTPQQQQLYLTEGKRLWDQLVDKLVEVGSVPESLAPISTRWDAHAPLQGFLRRYNRANLEHVAHLFVRLQPDTPTFLCQASNIQADVIEYDALINLIFKELSREPDEEFQIIMNMTSFTNTSIIPSRWVKHFVDLIPVELVERCRAIYFVNINRAAQSYLRKIYYEFAGLGLDRLNMSSISIADLRQMFPTSPALQDIGKNHASHRGYCSEPFVAEMDRSSAVEFNDVDLWDVFHTRHSCALRVSATQLYVETIKPQIIFPGFQARLMEVLPLAEIDDVVQSQAVQDESLFTVAREKGEALRFSSKDGEAIMRAIRKSTESAPGYKAKDSSRDYRFNAGTALLNVALVNLCHKDDTVRLASLGLLRSTAGRMGYNLTLLPAAYFVPANPYTTALSYADVVVKGLPHIVVDFLKDFSSSFGRLTNAEKIACLKYLRPFIKSLALESASQWTFLGRDSMSMRLRECIRHFIALTVNYDSVHGALQGSIWSVIARYEGLARLAVDEVVKAAVDGLAGTRKTDILADTLVLLSSTYARGKTIARLQKLLTRVTFRSSAPFTDNALWNEVAILTRLVLVLTSETENPMDVIGYFSELSHFITLLAGTGPDKMRVSVHGIALNLVQSLSNLKQESRTDFSSIQGMLEALRSPEFLRDFGLVQTKFAGLENTEVIVGTGQLPVDAMRRITGFLLEAAEAGARSLSQANAWRARWTSLLVATALRSPPYVQTRSYYILGTVLTSVLMPGPYIDDDLIHQFLHALDVIITKPVTDGKNNCLASILDCLCRILSVLPDESRYPTNLFWLAVMLFQANIKSLYRPLIELMREILNVFQRRRDLEQVPISDYLLDARTALDYDWSGIESHVGLNFRNYFSICLAHCITFALRNPDTQDAAKTLLYSLLMVTRSRDRDLEPTSLLSHDSIGYFLALVTISTTPAAMLQLLRTARVGENWYPAGLFETTPDPTITPILSFGMLGIQDHDKALVTAAFLLSLLKGARSDAERELLCHMLADISQEFPKVVEQIFDQLEKTTDVFSTSNNRSILEALGTIYSVVLTRQSNRSSTSIGRANSDGDGHSRAETTNSTTLQQALEDYGMTGLMGTPPANMLESCAQMTRTFT